MKSSPIGLATAGTLLAVACHGHSALAQNFYAGKQIVMIVGSGPGGGYDLYSRLLARHWGKHIPGKPSFVVQNMVGAGSLVATNMLANTASRDGLTIGQIQTHMSVEPLMGVTGSLANVKFDSRKLNWLGSAAKEYPLVVAWHTAPVKTFKDVLQREMVVGSSGVATSDSVYPRVMNRLLGTKFRIVDGYKSNPQLILASEIGEIMGRGGWFLSSLMSTQGTQLKAGKYRILVQVALERHPSLPDVPLVGDFLTDQNKRKQLEFALSWLPMGRPFVAPPGIPADRLEILRNGFTAAVKDPELLAEAKRANAEISALSGTELQALVEKLYTTPKDVIEAVRAIMVIPKGKKT